jgi:hypothetical protein
MSDFDVPNDYKLSTLQSRLEALNVEGWHNEEARTVATALGNLEEVERLTANIEIIKSAIIAVQLQVTDLA